MAPSMVFAAFGIGSQVFLVAFFAARRWSPHVAQRAGWLTYAFAALGLPLGIGLIVDGQTWEITVGPVLLALWAMLGAAVDLWRRIEWRAPILWRVFIPYVALYFWAQMFLWWPLWDVVRAGWFGFLVLFTTSTALNLWGHVNDRGVA